MSKLKILVVEDNRAIRALYDRGLREDFFEKSYAVDGREALDLYQTWRPDILLLDIGLPELSGYLVLKTIRSEIGDTRTPIIVITALGTADDVKSCIKLGIQGYLVKPVSVATLTERVLGCHRKALNARARGNH